MERASFTKASAPKPFHITWKHIRNQFVYLPPFLPLLHDKSRITLLSFSRFARRAHCAGEQSQNFSPLKQIPGLAALAALRRNSFFLEDFHLYLFQAAKPDAVFLQRWESLGIQMYLFSYQWHCWKKNQSNGQQGTSYKHAAEPKKRVGRIWISNSQTLSVFLAPSIT